MLAIDGQNYCIDPVGGIADSLGKKWTLPLITLLGNRPSNRFGELLSDLEGVGPKALADRLHEFLELGLISRQVFSDVPARVEYRLTMKGARLRRALVPLLEWASIENSTTEAS
jgi:DNA-binding HxlR family transcriptional regulator